MIKKSEVKSLFFVFFLAFFLRVMYLPQNALTFGYDQARDAFISGQIVAGDLKILGPPASTPGLFHGVFYYYFLAPAYLLGKGSPIVAAYWVALFNSFTVFLAYLLTKFITKDHKTSLLSGFLFAISYSATQYGTWLSNPTIGIWTVPLLYLGLWGWVFEKRKWAPMLLGLGLGLSIQAEIFLAYHLVPIGIWLWLGRKRITAKEIKQSLMIFLVSISSMILVEFKFGFKSFQGITNLLTGQDVVLARREVGDFIVLYLNQIGRTFSNSILPSNAGYGGFLGLLFLGMMIVPWMKNKKRKSLSWEPFLATFVLAHLPIVSMGGVSTPFLTVGLGVAVVIITAIVLTKLRTTNKSLAHLLLLILILSNLTTIFANNKKGQVMFAIQKDLLLSYQLDLVDYTYEVTDGAQFSINTITSPLWVNVVWSYLYNWYGQNTYGYLPAWRGRDQVGQLGNNLPTPNSDIEKHFLIKEPPQGIPQVFIDGEFDQENARSVVLEAKDFGDLQVQYREIVRDAK